jgi:hypothetical protein
MNDTRTLSDVASACERGDLGAILGLLKPTGYPLDSPDVNLLCRPLCGFLRRRLRYRRFSARCWLPVA